MINTVVVFRVINIGSDHQFGRKGRVRLIKSKELDLASFGEVVILYFKLMVSSGDIS